MKKLILLLLMVPVALPAQTLAERFENGIEITASEWQEMTRGRTVVYQSFGVETGREYYPPKGNKVFYRFADGECLEGTVSYSPPDFCFNWQGYGNMCFEHKYVDGEIFIMGEGNIVFVSDIVNDPFQCTAGLTSALDQPLAFAGLQ